MEPSRLYRVRYTVTNGSTHQTQNVFTFTKARDDNSGEGMAEGRTHGNQNRSRDGNAPRPSTSSVRRSQINTTDFSLSNTEMLMKSVGKVNNIMTSKELDRAILAARHSKDTTDFIMSGHKSLKPELRQDRLKKTMLVSHGIQVADTIYRHAEGRRLFKNDWFMGPFYSYGANERQMKRE